MEEYLDAPKTVLVKMEGEDLSKAWKQWNSMGGRKGSHQRFGQYVMNNYLQTVTDPSIFYNENAHEVYSAIWEKYCFHD